MTTPRDVGNRFNLTYHWSETFIHNHLCVWVCPFVCHYLFLSVYATKLVWVRKCFDIFYCMYDDHYHNRYKFFSFFFEYICECVCEWYLMPYSCLCISLFLSISLNHFFLSVFIYLCLSFICVCAFSHMLLTETDWIVFYDKPMPCCHRNSIFRDEKAWNGAYAAGTGTLYINIYDYIKHK